MRFSLIWQFFICFLYKIKALSCNSYEYIIICKNKEVLLHYFNYFEHKYHICLNLKTVFEGFRSLWELQNTSDQAQMWAHSQWIFLNDCVTRLTQTKFSYLCIQKVGSTYIPEIQKFQILKYELLNALSGKTFDTQLNATYTFLQISLFKNFNQMKFFSKFS